jgi:hypothetical protein
MTNDPTLDVDPDVEQIYKHSRTGEQYQILHIDNQIVLLRSDRDRRDGENAHRIERRVHFNKQIDAGEMQYQPDSDLDMIEFTSVDWSEVAHIGAVTNDNLHDAGFSTNLDVQQASDDELLEVDGVGNAGLTNLKSHAQ